MNQKNTQRNKEVKVKFVVDGTSKEASEQLTRDKFEDSVRKDYEAFTNRKGKEER